MENINNETNEKKETRGRPKTATIASNTKEYREIQHARFQDKKIKCDLCDVSVCYYSWCNHKRSVKHRRLLVESNNSQ